MRASSLRQALHRRKIHIAAFCFAIALFFILISHFILFKPLILAEYAFQDRILAAGHPSSPTDPVVFVGIDEASLLLDTVWEEEINASPALQAMSTGFPWPRLVYAQLLDRLTAAGASAVAFDLLFDDARAGDAEFAAAIQRHSDKVVLGANFDRRTDDSNNLYGGTTSLSLPSESLIPWPKISDPRIGFVSVWPDADEKLRTARYHITANEVAGRAPGPDEPSGLSFAAAALHRAGMEPLIPTDSTPHRFRFTKKHAITPIPLYSLFVPSLWESTYQNGEFFRDKIIVVGPAAPRFHDYQETPIGSMLGPLFHTNMILAAVNGAFYQTASFEVQVLLIFGCALLAWCCVVLFRHPLASLTAIAGCILAYLCGVIALFEFADYLLTGIAPLSTLVVGGVLALGYEFGLERLEKQRIRGTLERYVSRNVVREILDNKEAFLESLGGTRKQVTILFSDVRGFTAKSEGADPAELVTQLNEYLAKMVDMVFRNEGTVDKFIGDAVMAVWGNVSHKSAQENAILAVTAALEMKEALAELNLQWQKNGRDPFEVGIGLNHGEAIFGNIGSEQKMEPTVIGDAVNLASRVEGLTKEFKSDLLITGSLAELVRDRFVLRTVSNVAVKGKRQPVDIYMVLSRASQPQPEWLADYETGIQLFRSRKFSEAHSAFQSAAIHHNDFLTTHYLAQSLEYASTPPAPDWSGAIIMQHK